MRAVLQFAPWGADVQGAEPSSRAVPPIPSRGKHWHRDWVRLPGRQARGIRVSNSFDDENATFLVLMNEENQHSLLPSFAAVPEGWTVAHGPDNRASCLDYVEADWTDVRPASLIRAMAEA